MLSALHILTDLNLPIDTVAYDYLMPEKQSALLGGDKPDGGIFEKIEEEPQPD